MSSENFTLPHFADLCQSLNVPSASRRGETLLQPNVEPIPPLFESPPVVNIGLDGYEVIQGPLNHAQCCMLQGRSVGQVLQNPSAGNHYAMFKGPTAQCVPVQISDKCYVSSPKEPGGFCFIQRQSARVQKPDIPPYKAHGNGFIVYLHRPLGDQRSIIPVQFAIPFISTDMMDKALGLPGVSIGRLLRQEPGILDNANSVMLQPEWRGSTFGIRVEIAVAGYNGVITNYPISTECTHGCLTHLGLARMLAYGFYNVLKKNPQRTVLSAANLRLVAVYKLEGSKDDIWNVAYAVVNP